MTAPSPLDTLIELARQRTDDAMRRLGELQRGERSANEQLQVLQRYRSDYARQLDDRMAEGLPLLQLQNFQHFLDLLDAALDQQHERVRQALAQVDDGRTQWRTQAGKLQAFDTLSERQQRQVMLARGRKEQKDSDERAARPRALSLRGF